MGIKEMVGPGKQVTFVSYRQGNLWYSTECGFHFPVPISDTGDAEFCNSDKALLYMRWIRKHMEMIEQEKLKNPYS